MKKQIVLFAALLAVSLWLTPVLAMAQGMATPSPFDEEAPSDDDSD